MEVPRSTVSFLDFSSLRLFVILVYVSKKMRRSVNQVVCRGISLPRDVQRIQPPAREVVHRSYNSPATKQKCTVVDSGTSLCFWHTPARGFLAHVFAVQKNVFYCDKTLSPRSIAPNEYCMHTGIPVHAVEVTYALLLLCSWLVVWYYRNSRELPACHVRNAKTSRKL